jgi:hypothetical protein
MKEIVKAKTARVKLLRKELKSQQARAGWAVRRERRRKTKLKRRIGLGPEKKEKKKKRRKEKKLGLGPIDFLTQGPMAHLLSTPKFSSPIRIGPPKNPKPN